MSTAQILYGLLGWDAEINKLENEEEEGDHHHSPTQTQKTWDLPDWSIGPDTASRESESGASSESTPSKPVKSKSAASASNGQSSKNTSGSQPAEGVSADLEDSPPASTSRDVGSSSTPKMPNNGEDSKPSPG
ncbi:hypothetical protein IWZ03DRAFT_426635 [Phyllosticta citriasiana]|uniref:Uncharacterized protein n=1 Tax=Phyllosticta citriasiana TaxID=595635 RepID=A0ABR1KB12_9PEZI